jgi:hypothetical protein
MLKKFTVLAMLATVSAVSGSLIFQKHAAASSSPQLPKIEIGPVRGGPCLPGLPRC